jgi:predicted alpha/beta superfamily hydrolase
LTGLIGFHRAFPSRFLKNTRDIIVYLPPGYNDPVARRYPVLFMHDGQNLFDSATSFARAEWGLDETAETLIRDGQIEPLIIVGIYNTGLNRLAEYTQVADRAGRGGRADAYGKLLIKELKPFIDSEYRTLPGPANTGLGGSSLGGLVSLFLGLRHPLVFGKLIVMSPSVWWANRAILRNARRASHAHSQRIWLDIGRCEGSCEDQNSSKAVRDAADVRDVLLARGWELGRDLQYLEAAGAGHNELAWGARIGDALQFLFPPVSS